MVGDRTVGGRRGLADRRRASLPGATASDVIPSRLPICTRASCSPVAGSSPPTARRSPESGANQRLHRSLKRAFDAFRREDHTE